MLGNYWRECKVKPVRWKLYIDDIGQGVSCMNDDATHQRTARTGFDAQGDESLHTQDPQGLIREQLSALMDGELGEFETRRLLTLLNADDSSGSDCSDRTASRQLLAAWERYHLVRSALRPEPMMASLESELESESLNSADFTSRLSLSDRINAQIADEPIPQAAPESVGAAERRDTRAPTWTWGAGRIAVAATVALSVFLGMQALVQHGNGVPAGDNSLVAERSGLPVPERQFAVDSDAQQRLNDYIRSVSIPARSESQAAPYTNLLESSPLLRPVADRELVVPDTQLQAD